MADRPAEVAPSDGDIRQPGALVDLSRPITVESSYKLWGDMLDSNPHLLEIQVDYISQFPTANGTVCRFALCDHTATHIDAPIHTVDGGSALEGVDVSRLVGEAIVLDMYKGHVDYAYTAGDLAEAGGDVRAGDIVLIYSGYQDATPTERMRQTHLSVEAAEWLVDRGVKAVGCEPVGIEHLYDAYYVHGYYDVGHPNPWPVHRTLLGNSVYIIEGLTNLEPLRGRRVQFAALPLLFPGLSGSPVRAVAWA